MNNLYLPPFPALGASGPQVCEAVRFYMGIVDELPFEQVRILSEHMKGCPRCAAEFRVVQQTTRAVASMPSSMPSKRVDDAIMAFLNTQQLAKPASVQLHPEKQRAGRTPTPLARKRAPFYSRPAGALALVAVLALVLVLGGVFVRGLILPASSPQAFQLPNNLSWTGYVLHYTQNKDNTQGKSYQVEVYQDLGTNQMHIESTMQGKFDVVVVTDQQDMVGEDMMHHVVQKGNSVVNWTVDGSTFDLALLRQSLTTQHATYLGQSSFAGQQVYQIRVSNSQILLLNMQYFPVNVLDSAVGSSTGTPMYTTFELMHSAQVPDSMWDMQVPTGFHTGKLPTHS